MTYEYYHYQTTSECYNQALSIAEQYIDLQEYIENFICNKLMKDHEGLDSFSLSPAGDDICIDYITEKISCSCCPSEHGSGSVLLSTMFDPDWDAKQQEKLKKAQSADKRAKTMAKKKLQQDQLKKAEATIARINAELKRDNI